VPDARPLRVPALAAAAILAGALGAAAQQAGHGHGPPAGWKFVLPKGDPARGRAVFTKLECYACHEVRGQAFPGVREGATIGPELSGMAAHHDAEFFAEAIVNPGAVIDDPKWRGPDGSSKMPSFNHVMTVEELVDLVAFLKSLTPPPEGGGGHRH
jgi:mono/diheme cytochrome c family protein